MVENPSAFPIVVPIDFRAAEYGMTLRDWFAGQALAGMGTWMPQGYTNLNADGAAQARAEWAYNQADALLAARQKGGEA